jgi:hypothetical protein
MIIVSVDEIGSFVTMTFSFIKLLEQEGLIARLDN